MADVVSAPGEVRAVGGFHPDVVEVGRQRHAAGEEPDQRGRGQRGAEPARQIAAGHDRHDEVADDQVHCDRIPLQKPGRFDTAVRLDHAVSRLGQGAGQEDAYHLLVIHDEDRALCRSGRHETVLKGGAR